MGSVAGKGIRIYMNGHDLSSFFNSMTGPTESVDTSETTTFGDEAKTHLPTLTSATMSFDGYFDGAANAVDSVVSAALGVGGDEVISLPGGDAAGNLAYSMVSQITSYENSGSVDGMVETSLECQSNVGAERTIVLAPLAAIAVTTTSAEHDNLASTTAGGAGYLQVSTVTGTTPNLEVTIEDSSTGAFAGEETVIATFTPVVASNKSERIAISGTIERHTRAVLTVTGTTPSFTAWVGIHRA